MPLVNLVPDEDIDDSIRPALEAGRAQYGSVLNTWRVLANRPPVFAAYLPYLRSIAGPGALEQRIKELTAVRTVLLLHCRYSVSHRLRAARAAGITDEELTRLSRGDFSAFSSREQLALRLADQLTLRAHEVQHSVLAQVVDPDLLVGLRREFDDASLVDLALNVSLWNSLARFHRVMGLGLDMPAPPPAIDAEL